MQHDDRDDEDQGVCRKNLLDTMLFFSIKDPQDHPSLPLLPN